MILGCEVVLGFKIEASQDVRTEALVCLVCWDSDAPLA